MHIYIKEKPNIDKSVVALGFFDGVHIGHRELIKKAVAEGKRLNAPVAVYTFFDHPRNFIFPKDPARCIFSNEEKANVLEELGVDILIYEDFPRVMDYSPSRFVDEILIGELRAESAVCGFNFRFGKDNSGDTDTLKNLLRPHGADLSVIPPVCAGDMPVSSGRIRELIEKGELETANLLLCRPFSVTESVCHGHRLGHTLGFPTANIVIPKTRPALPNGVYFTKTCYKGREYISVTNIGTRPTVDDGETEAVCETYITDFDKEIYEEAITVKFFKMHRCEKKFDSLEALSLKLKNDVVDAQRYFKKEEEK